MWGENVSLFQTWIDTGVNAIIFTLLENMTQLFSLIGLFITACWYDWFLFNIVRFTMSGCCFMMSPFLCGTCRIRGYRDWTSLYCSSLYSQHKWCNMTHHLSVLDCSWLCCSSTGHTWLKVLTQSHGMFTSRGINNCFYFDILIIGGEGFFFFSLGEGGGGAYPVGFPGGIQQKTTPKKPFLNPH